MNITNDETLLEDDAYELTKVTPQHCWILHPDWSECVDKFSRTAV